MASAAGVTHTGESYVTCHIYSKHMSQQVHVICDMCPISQEVHVTCHPCPRKYGCSTDSCYTSKDREEQLSTFDAVVFHERSLDKDDLPEQRLDI